MLRDLPEPVRRYLNQTGTVGKLWIKWYNGHGRNRAAKEIERILLVASSQRDDRAAV